MFSTVILFSLWGSPHPWMDNHPESKMQTGWLSSRDKSQTRCKIFMHVSLDFTTGCGAASQCFHWKEYLSSRARCDIFSSRSQNQICLFSKNLFLPQEERKCQVRKTWSGSALEASLTLPFLHTWSHLLQGASLGTQTPTKVISLFWDFWRVICLGHIFVIMAQQF